VFDFSGAAYRSRQLSVEETQELATLFKEVFAATSEWANYQKAKTRVQEIFRAKGYDVE
jgi:hypothetical protein